MPPRITSASRNPVNKLPLKKRTYLTKRLEGATIGDAAEAAGISRRHGCTYEKAEDVQAAYRELMKKTLPMKRMVKLIKGGTEATMPVFTPDGKRRKDRPDWRARRPYIEMAVEQAGYHEKKEDPNSSSSFVNVVVHHIGGATREKTATETTRPEHTIAAETDQVA